MVDIDLMATFGNKYFWAGLLTFARFLGILSIHPLFSSGYFSLLLRAGLALILAIMILPLTSSIELNIGIFGKFMLLAANFTYGYILGYFLGLPIWLIESCGQIIDTQRGEQMGAVVNQLTRNTDSSIGRLLTQGFIVYFVVNKGIIFIFNAAFESFRLVPINNIFPVFNAEHIDKYIGFFKEYFYWVVVLVMPVVFTLLLVDIALGLIGSFIPQLNVTVISMPIKSLMALLILSIYLGGLFHNVFAKFIIQFSQLY